MNNSQTTCDQRQESQIYTPKESRSVFGKMSTPLVSCLFSLLTRFQSVACPQPRPKLSLVGPGLLGVNWRVNVTHSRTSILINTGQDLSLSSTRHVPVSSSASHSTALSRHSVQIVLLIYSFGCSSPCSGHGRLSLCHFRTPVRLWSPNRLP